MRPIIKSFDEHVGSEDMGSLFFDADGDGDQDLYVVSGGNEYEEGTKFYNDRLYINEGRNLVHSKNAIPQIPISGSCVKAADYDKDGDLDLFVGGRLVPYKYPFAPNSLLLENEGGSFKEVSKEKAPGFEKLGMVTDATWLDFDKDGDQDLVVVGEWMPVTVFVNENGKLENRTAQFGLEDSKGWWNCVEQADIDGDGDLDLIAGNLGENYKYQASKEEPFHVYAGDVDKNGRSDIILGQYNQNTLFPVRGLQCSSEQIPELAEKFPTYHEFGKATLPEVYGEQLDELFHLEVSTFASSIIVNNGSSFEVKPLDRYAQISPVNNVVIDDVNNDNKLDLILAGNLYASEVETGRADSGIGLVMLGDGLGQFSPKFGIASGLLLDKDVRDFEVINSGNERYLFVANNNEEMEVLQFTSQKLSQ